MHARDAMESRTLRVDQGEVRGVWRYEGVGLRNSFARPRFWVLAVCVIVPLTVYGYIFIGPRADRAGSN